MPTEAVGAYLLLLCAAWAAEPPCTIPDDDAWLAAVTRLTPARWSELRPVVLAPWRARRDGLYEQPRLLSEYAKFLDRQAKRKAAGEAGAEARWQTHNEGMANACHPPPEPQPDPNQRQKPPTTSDLYALKAYSLEVVKIDLAKAGVPLAEILSDFGLAGVVDVLEHLASRRPSERVKGVRNYVGFVKSLCQKSENERLPREGDYESFADWRARADARVKGAA